MSKKTDTALHAIKELVNLFRLERLTYLCITVISALILLSVAISMVIRSDSNEFTLEIIGLFGSSGTITFAISRLLKMWTDSVAIMQKALEDE